jgi:hypothetical protein
MEIMFYDTYLVVELFNFFVFLARCLLVFHSRISFDIFFTLYFKLYFLAGRLLVFR